MNLSPMNSLLPEVEEEPLPPPRDNELVLAPRQDALLTNPEIDAAAKACGMEVIDAKMLRDLKTLGAHVDNLGAIHVGLGRVIATQDWLAKMAAEATRLGLSQLPDAVVSDGPKGTTIVPGMERQLNAMNTANALIGRLMEGASLLHKMTASKTLKNPQDKQKARSFQPGQIVGQHVQINVHNSDEKNIG